MKKYSNIIEEIINRFNNNELPFEIAKSLNIESSLVKYYLKINNLFEYNTQNNRLKNWELIDPDNNVYNTNNISIFAKEHKLNHSNLRKLAHGKLKNYKNWKCKIL